MSASENSLISRAEYLGKLERVQLQHIDEDGRSCAICGDPFSHSPFHTQPHERPVRVHNVCVLGEQCLRTWLSTEHTCPCCRHSLFRPESDTILAPADTTADGKCLGRLRVWATAYAYALHTRDHQDVDDNFRLIVAILRSRITASPVDPDVQYRPYRSMFRGMGSDDEGDNGDDVPTPLSTKLGYVDAPAATLALWQWWWKAFATTNDRATHTLLHHPWASALLFEVIAALNRWGGWNVSARELHVLLRSRVRGFCTRVAESASVPDAWTPYVDDLLMTASRSAHQIRSLQHGRRGFEIEDHRYLAEIDDNWLKR